MNRSNSFLPNTALKGTLRLAGRWATGRLLPLPIRARCTSKVLLE